MLQLTAFYYLVNGAKRMKEKRTLMRDLLRNLTTGLILTLT